MLQEEKPTLIREQKLNNRTPRQKSIFSRSFHIVDILRQHALICKNLKIVLVLKAILFPTG